MTSPKTSEDRFTMEQIRLNRLVTDAIAGGDAERIRAAYSEVQRARQENIPAAPPKTIAQRMEVRATRVHLIGLADTCRSALGIAR
jgi:hypothetical protein